MFLFNSDISKLFSGVGCVGEQQNFCLPPSICEALMVEQQKKEGILMFDRRVVVCFMTTFLSTFVFKSKLHEHGILAS
jgi:hypothetical protein